MAYALLPGESLSDACHRIAVEEVDAALAQLRSLDDPAAAVHEARKSFKRVRSLLRLLRAGVPAAERRRAMHAVRDLGRLLSDARDVKVRLDTLAGLLAWSAGAVGERAVVPLRETLLTEHVTGAERTADAARQVVEGLRDVREGLLALPVEDDPGVLVAGLERTYGRGRNRMAEAWRNPTDETLHEWRKRAKDLWHHVELVAPAWPALLETTAGLAHDLSDALGEDHDLALLTAAAAERPGAFATPADQRTLADLIAQRRRQLQETAHGLGPRLYAEKPRPYARRLGRYVAIWHEERA
jgi:CHAD domain-containing protein